STTKTLPLHCVSMARTIGAAHSCDHQRPLKAAVGAGRTQGVGPRRGWGRSIPSGSAWWGLSAGSGRVVDEPVPDRVVNELALVGETHFLHQARLVRADGLDRHIQLL